MSGLYFYGEFRTPVRPPLPMAAKEAKRHSEPAVPKPPFYFCFLCFATRPFRFAKASVGALPDFLLRL